MNVAGINTIISAKVIEWLGRGQACPTLAASLPSIGQDLSKGDLADNVLPEESTALLYLCNKLIQAR